MAVRRFSSHSASSWLLDAILVHRRPLGYLSLSCLLESCPVCSALSRLTSTLTTTPHSSMLTDRRHLKSVEHPFRPCHPDSWMSFWRHCTVGRVGLLARHEAKSIFLKQTILLHRLGIKISISHIWCIDAPKTPLVSMQHGFKHSCSVRRRHWCRTRYFHRIDYKWL